MRRLPRGDSDDRYCGLDARKVRSGLGAGATRPTDSPPFRFYDNRQKYLAFVNTCNEKATVARRAAQELSQLRPQPPALRIFDAGMGDATVLSRLMGSAHRDFPTVPLAGRGERDQSRGRAARAREDAGSFLRAPAHGGRDHEPELHGGAAVDAARGPTAAGLAHAAAEGQFLRTNTSSRSKRWARC